MRSLRVSTLLGLVAAAPAPREAPVIPTPREALDIPAPAIVMLWAPWCAPCRDEVRHYHDLAHAAYPVPLYVVALDTSDRETALLSAIPPDRLRIARAPSVTTVPQWLPSARGLPLTVALDQIGTRCAVVTQSPTVATIAELKRRCGLS